MANLIVDPRDQKFVHYEMLNVEELFKAQRYVDFSRDTVDIVLMEAEKMAVEVLFPTLAEGDREGCKLEGGAVRMPKAFHRLYKLYCANRVRIAAEKLNALYQEEGIDSQDTGQAQAFVKRHPDAAFYAGKGASARYFIKHVLPEAYAAATAIRSEDLSMVKITDESFAS